MRSAAWSSALGAGISLAAIASSQARVFYSSERMSLEFTQTMVNTEGPHNAPAGDPPEGPGGPPYAISLSGATLMRTYTTSPGSTHDAGRDLNNDQSITASPECMVDGACAALPMPVCPDGDLDGDNFFGYNPCFSPALDQLAAGVNGGPGHFWTIYYREEGSVGGIEDLADSQIGNPPGTILPLEGPNTANPVWVNRNRFQAPGTVNGFTLDDTHPQPAVQMAVSDVKVAQAFAKAGTPAWNRRPLQAGYGLNPAIAATYVNGQPGGMDQLLRLDTTLGPDGLGTLHDETVAIGSVSVIANPGLGLTQISDVELQWLLVHGRFPNGTNVNVVTRDVNSGTRNTYCNNLRLDVSWGMGENDGGGPGPYPNVNLLGLQIRYSDKASNSHVDPTVRTARYSIGLTTTSTALSAIVANNLDLLRVDYTAASGESPDDPQAYLPTIANITSGKYRMWSQQQYVRALNPNYNPGQTTVCPTNWPYKGDPNCQVQAYVQNLHSSEVTFPNLGTAFTPADALLANNFVLPNAMQVAKTLDGDDTIPNPNYNSSLEALLLQFYQNPIVAPEQVTGNHQFDPDGAGAVISGQPINAANEIMGNFNFPTDAQRTLADISRFADALAHAPAASTMPCATQGCTPNPYVYNNGSADLYPLVMADFNSDGAVNKADAEFFCTTVTNASGFLAQNQCLNLFRNDPSNPIAVRANADVNGDGIVNCADVQIVQDLLAQAGPDGTLFINNFDDAFIIGKRIAAEQNDDGKIDAADQALVNAAAGGSCIVNIVSANPPAAAQNGGLPFRDVLENTTAALIAEGIGVTGTPSEGAVNFAPFQVTFSSTPSPAPTTANIVVSCTGGTCPTVTAVSGSGAGPYSITLSGSPPVLHCITFTFAGASPGQKLQYQNLPGDTNLNGTTTGQDVLNLVAALNNGTANSNAARYDINRNGTVTGQDVLREVQLINGGAGVSPPSGFNGAAVAACP